VPAVGTARGHLGEPASAPVSGESISLLTSGPGWRVEQILTGELSKPIEDRLDHDEWVIVLGGWAVLDVDGTEERLAAGDWIVLRAGVPHRVCAAARPTSWLAFHVGGESTGPTP
jgi:cupin 2 domain-containing protein